MTTKRFFTIDEVLADFERDPEARAAMDKARAEMDEMKRTMGEQQYYHWLASHFVNIRHVDQ